MSDLESSVPYGYCHCGCGRKTAISDRTHTKYGHVKGKPMKFIKGHAAARARATRSAKRQKEGAALAEEHRRKWEAEHPDLPYGTCLCGCGEPTEVPSETHRSMARFKGLPMRYKRGHANRGSGQSPVDRSVRDESTGCLVHQGPLSKAGYAVLSYRGQDMYGHRFVYEQAYGTIPEGMEVHHVCSNRACQEVAHLELVTPQVHGALSASQRSKLNANTKLTREKVRQIRSLVAAGESRAKIAQQFDVAYTTISGIINGKNWKDV